jgi:hypothetical protein
LRVTKKKKKGSLERAMLDMVNQFNDGGPFYISTRATL